MIDAPATHAVASHIGKLMTLDASFSRRRFVKQVLAGIAVPLPVAAASAKPKSPFEPARLPVVHAFDGTLET